MVYLSIVRYCMVIKGTSKIEDANQQGFGTIEDIVY
jgi:hypothetical protein